MFRQSARINGQTVLTLYGAVLYERRHAGAATEHTHHVQANGRTVATVKREGTSPTNTTRYLHKDHLGSVVAITGETGAIVESLAYDAWGKRRPAATWQTPAPGVFIAAITLTRGFTMHEHLDQVGLVHMGGRVYDPELGRFLSPDPFVQFAISTQGFNRYAYVGNNPLSYTDPSGYFLKKALRIGLSIAASYYTGGWATGLFNSAAAGAAVGGAVGGYLNTGSLQGAMLGALAGGVAYGIGHKVPGFEGASYAEPGKLLAKSLTHGVTQGLIAKAGGGRFGDGALGAFAASIGGPSVARAGPGIHEAMAAAALGGTVSVIGGGKFANGAIAAAWVNLFNDQGRLLPEKPPGDHVIVEIRSGEFQWIHRDYLEKFLWAQATGFDANLYDADSACVIACVASRVVAGQVASVAGEKALEAGAASSSGRWSFLRRYFSWGARAVPPASHVHTLSTIHNTFEHCAMTKPCAVGASSE